MSGIYVTYVETFGSFLKVWGQVEPTTPIAIEKALSNMIPQFEQGLFIPNQENLRVDQVICAKFKDGLYYRACITNLSHLHEGMLEVRFIDYGNTDVVSFVHTRTLSQHSPGLVSIPPQAQSFLLASVTHIGDCWDQNIVMYISNELRYFTFQYRQILQISSQRLIQLIRENEDVATLLAKRGLVTYVSLQAQQIFIDRIVKNITMPPMHPVLNQGIVQQNPSPIMQMPLQSEPLVLVYKSFCVEPYSTHSIYVSYVLDGPCHFSVQLKSMEEKLARLMSELNSMPLMPLDEIPLPGKVCLARCAEDDHICRAVVTSQVDNKYKIFFVDFGNTELLRVEDLYEIPHSKILPKVMALRFSLAGIERSTVTMEMKYAFKNFVSDKLLTMRAIPPISRSCLPTCELWDENKTSVLDIIKRAAMNAYPGPLVLNRGFNQEVRVSYVYSCKQFFVQLKSKEGELQKLMIDLQEYCNSNQQPLPATMIKVGTPCCALFEVDMQWYRAQILDVNDVNIKVRYVDYGNDNLVPIGNLRMLQSKHILPLRPQAIECCLNGYQNMTPDSARDTFLEEIILEKDFCMKVIEMIGTCVLVDLIDTDKYNVASLLLDKIASSSSLISPLLVQDGNKVDHRKNSNPFQSPNSPKDYNFRQEMRASRDQNAKSWEEKSPPGHDNRNKYRNDHSTDDNRPDFRSRGGRSNFNDRSDDTRRNDGKRDFNKSDRGYGRHEGAKQFGSRGEGKRDFDRNDNRRDFDRNDNKRDFDRNENRRDFDRGDSKKEFGGRYESRKDFSRNENDRDFNKRDGNRSFGNNRNDNNRDFGRNKDNNRPPYNREKSWSSNDGSKRNKNGFHKDGSEKSWSDGSDKGFKKSPRSNVNNTKQRFNKNLYDKNSFNKPSNNRANFKASEEFEESLDIAPADAVYKILDLSGQTKAVSISWFHNPSYFYCQLNESHDQFRNMMEELQKTYPKRKPADAKNGAPVVSLFPEDGVFYRGRVTQAQFAQYRVQYVDFGNFCTVDKVWPIDNKFMELPSQAFCCGLALNPTEEKWPQPDTYCTYFDKEEFVCNFVSKVDNKYIIDLTHDGISVGQSLLAVGLAASTESTVTKIDINILVRQQLRARIMDVNSLNDFKIEIQPNYLVPATMHNLATATETFEDKLKELNETFAILYIDNIVDDRIEVTLYDLQGYKMQILQPDEGAIVTIWTLCALPVFYPSLHGYVSWVTTASIFIQPSGYEDTIAQLLDQLYQYYSTAELEYVKEPVEGNIYAVHSSDNNWYRGSVTAIENESVTVMFLDYGNTESVPFTELRDLVHEFTELHTLAIEVYIQDDPSKYQEQELTIKLTNTEEGWLGEVEEVLEQQEQQTIAEEEVIASIDAQQPQEVADEIISEQLETVPTEIVDKTSVQSGIAVVISHIDSPSEFYVQLHSALSMIDTVQATLQEQINSFPDLENSTAGVLCAAPYSLDSLWYRAQVLDADTDITTVRFVDFGSTDVLDNHSTHIKTLPSDLLALEQHARRCSLNIKPIEEEWSIAASQRFETLAYEDESLSAEIIHQDEKTTYVELYVKNKNIAEVLVNEGLAAKLELEIDNNLTGFVSHLNSPSEFWIQLESSVADLEWIADQLSTANTFPELEDLSPGALCAAIFSEDEQWYRARILSNTVAGIEVLFIDYGNSCTCSSLRELPEELVMLPALAQKCTLKKPSGLVQWTPQAADKFKEISADGVTIFKIHRLTTGETSEVELLLNGEDVSLQLLPKTVNAVVTKFESFDSLWILRADDKEPIECKLEVLPGFAWTEAATNKFDELTNKGNTIFEVEPLCDGNVRLYLNGRDVRYDLDCIKVATSKPNTPKKNYVNACVSETMTQLLDNVMDGVQEFESAEGAAGSENIEETPDVSEKMPEVVDEAPETAEKAEMPNLSEEALDNLNLDDQLDDTLILSDTSKADVVMDEEQQNDIAENESQVTNIAENESTVPKVEIVAAFEQQLVVEFSSKQELPKELNIKKGDANDVMLDLDNSNELDVASEKIQNVRKEDSSEKPEEQNIASDDIMDLVENGVKDIELSGGIEKQTTSEQIKVSADNAACVKPVITLTTSTDTLLTHSCPSTGSGQTHSTPKAKKIYLSDSTNSDFNRSASFISSRYNVDEMIVPGAISRPHTPFVSMDDELSLMQGYFSTDDIKGEGKSGLDMYISIDDLSLDEEDMLDPETIDLKIEEIVTAYANYVKISNDDRIVPGAISSPQPKISEETVSSEDKFSKISKNIFDKVPVKLDNKQTVDVKVEKKTDFEESNLSIVEVGDVETNEGQECDVQKDSALKFDEKQETLPALYVSNAFLELQNADDDPIDKIEDVE